MIACAHFFISGRVQGVGYRYSARQHARGLQLTGWVRNLADGRVELLACGSDDALAQLERWLGRGPLGAQVTTVVRNSTAHEAFTDFEIC